MSIETVIKTVQGEAEYITTQEFGSVENAYKDHNPLTDLETKVLETRTVNTKYKLKKDENKQINADSITTANNITNI
jgi:hypothetical protein